MRNGWKIVLRLGAIVGILPVLGALLVLEDPVLIAQSCTSAPAGAEGIFYADQYADLPTAMAAANLASGDVYLIPGTSYTISSTLKIGTVSKRAHLHMRANTILNCAMTDGSNCITISDGSGIHGPPGITAQELTNGSNGYITCPSGAHMANVITNALQDGSQQTATVEGVEFIGASGCTVDQAAIHLRGLFSGTSLRNMGARKLYSTIGILLDTPGGVSNGSAALITPTAVSGSGTTMSITVPASTTATPDGHLVWVGGKINLANCSGGTGTFNGTNLVVASVVDNTHITVTASGTVSGSPTSCTYSPVDVLNIASVYHLENIVVSGGQTGSRPMVISSNNGGSMGGIGCLSCDLEGADAGLPELEINGNGNNVAIQQVIYTNFRMEGRGDANAGTIGTKIRDASNINVFGVACGNQIGTAGQTCFDISQSSTQHTYNINLYGIVDQGWANVVTNHITSTTQAASNSGANKTASYAQYHYAGLNWDGTSAGVVVNE